MKNHTEKIFKIGLTIWTAPSRQGNSIPENETNETDD